MDSYDDDALFERAATPLSQRAMAARPMLYLDDLNPAQREAVETLEGPVLMLAGAGTGKTKTLMARVAHLIVQGKARPNEVLAVTFTNKAAREMKARLEKTPFDLNSPLPWLGTFHAICVKLLRRHAELIGVGGGATSAVPGRDASAEADVLDPRDQGTYDLGPVPRPPGPLEYTPARLHLRSNFTILDSDDQLRLLKQLVQAEGIDDKRWPARALASLIDGWKNRGFTPAKVPTAEHALYNNRGVELYARYQHRLLELNAVDFGDLLLHMVTIFQTHEDLLQQYRRWFRYILVDEYQDTNTAQYLWLRLLAGGHHNICCVGDDDQSIYGWRGAEVGNILRFEKDFPGARVIRLEQNYRSTPHILAAASRVIAGNRDRLGKELWTEARDGHKVYLANQPDGDTEARWIGEEIEDAQAGRGRYRHRSASAARARSQGDPEGNGPAHDHGGYSLDEVAILVRASHQMRAFEDRFLTIGLPYRVIGGPRFYERMEIRDAMAYFRVVTSPDDDLAFERIVNTPKRGVGAKAMQMIQQGARANGVSLLEATRLLLAAGEIKGRAKSALGQLIDGFDRWAKSAREGAMSHVELAEIVLDESGYTEMWQNDKTPEAPGRLDNLKELIKALDDFENLQGFLEHVALIMDNDNGRDEPQVTIMTLHAAKGLEFPVVFLPGWEDGIFPSQRSMDESGEKGLEEERRLAYVGITRAEEICTISFASSRRVYGQWQGQIASRFIDELPEDHVEIVTAAGVYGDAYAMPSAPSGLENRAARADVYNSPGWARMQSRMAVQGGGARMGGPVIDSQAVASFTQGDRVFHQKFGYGYVMGIEADKLDIEFEKAGAKKVVAKFVVAADRADDVPF